jgi:small-conductance mechanosensitive channel
VQRWLDAKFLPRTRLDVGLRTSIRTGVGYVGVLLAALIGISYVGLNLGNIAIVAGALSVGIGFGLQSIVNNFVSGLILLAERPIKAGDWIVVGGDQGFVKRINVRATEIETFDRASVIIPNSNLIGGVVKNWMHGDTTGRVLIPVGVAYDSDPERVRSLLLGCAEDHASVLVYPEPRVFFKNFGESALDFELMCFVGDVTQAARVASDLRFAILKRLRQDGIEIPFAQRELRLRDIDRLEAIAERFGRPRRPIPAAVPAE